MKKCEGIKFALEELENDIDYYESQRELNEQEYHVYIGLVTEYNAFINQYNDLAKSAYSRWRLLPFPAPSKSLAR